MSDNPDLLLTTTTGNKNSCISLWDYNSENLLKAYKQNGVFSSNGIGQIGHDFIVAASGNTPLIHIWPINSQEPLKQDKIILSAPANALAVSHNNCYLACGIGAKLYVWQIASGGLLYVHEKHVQPITCIKFSNDDNFLITSGADGQLITYNFGSLISVTNPSIDDVKPLYNRLDHTMSIYGLHVGNFGVKSRLATASLDHTCRMYTLITGEPLLTLIYNEPLTAVIFDVFCWQLYVGSNSGLITQFNIKNPPRTLDFHVDEDCTNKLNFTGHSKKINCLCLNISNNILISGSDDAHVIIWDVESRQSIRKIELDSAVNNVKLILNHHNIFADRFSTEWVMKKLGRTMSSESCTISVKVNDRIDIQDEVSVSGDDKNEKERLESELQKQKIINQQIYNYARDLIEKYHSIT